MCGGHKLGVARSRAAKQEPPTCFGDFAAAKSGRRPVRTLLHDGAPNPFTNGDLLHCAVRDALFSAQAPSVRELSLSAAEGVV